MQILTRDGLEQELRAANEEARVPDLSHRYIQRLGAHQELLDYRGLDLYQTDVRSTRWSGLFLNRIDFQGADVSLAEFANCTLPDACFERTTMRNVIMDYCDCSQASFRLATLDDATFSYCFLDASNWNAASCKRIVLQGVFAPGAMFHHTKLIGAICEQMNLTDGELRGASCQGSNWTGANLTRVDCTYADFSQAILIDTVLDGATLAWTKLYGVLLGPESDLAEYMLRRAYLGTIKTRVFALCNLAAREKVQQYSDQLLPGVVAPSLFEALGVEKPEDCAQSMKIPHKKMLLAVARFLGAMQPCVREDGSIHPLWNPEPVRRILAGWLGEWLGVH